MAVDKISLLLNEKRFEDEQGDNVKTVTYFQVIDLDDRYGPLKVFRTEKEAVDFKAGFEPAPFGPDRFRIEPMIVE